MSPQLARMRPTDTSALTSAFEGNSGPDMLGSSSSHFDPNVWSGSAVQEASSTWLMRSCINVSGLCLERVLLRAIKLSGIRPWRGHSRLPPKANWTLNEVRCVDLLGDEQEQCPWPSKCESFIAAPMAIVGISPATSI